MAMLVDTEFQIGQAFFLKTDEDQKERIVSRIIIMPGGVLQYALSCGTSDTWHYALEITADKNILKNA